MSCGIETGCEECRNSDTACEDCRTRICEGHSGQFDPLYRLCEPCLAKTIRRAAKCLAWIDRDDTFELLQSICLEMCGVEV